MRGYLLKENKRFGTSRRWFTLTGAVLANAAGPAERPTWEVTVLGTALHAGDTELSFVLTTPSRKVLLTAPDAASRDAWAAALADASRRKFEYTTAAPLPGTCGQRGWLRCRC